MKRTTEEYSCDNCHVQLDLDEHVYLWVKVSAKDAPRHEVSYNLLFCDTDCRSEWEQNHDTP